MKLHIGCGNRYFEGWTNLDILEGTADVIDDARVLSKIPDSSCDIIYAAHVLEHFGRHEVNEVITVWFKKLKKGGILRLSVPDFEKIVKMYSKGTDLKTLLGYICGGQKDDFDFHKMIFDESTLSELLHNAGFKKTNRWNWKETDHSQYDDYSQAYLPHMDKEHGVMMSLNLEAIK